MELEEFKGKVLKRGNKAKNKIQNADTAYPAYKWIRKNGWLDLERPVTEKEFYAIIKMVNFFQVEEFLKGHVITFPFRMGRVELRKFKTESKFTNDGKLKVTHSIDWEKTLRLWYKDEDAYKKKILIRRDDEWSYQIVLQKNKCVFKNQEFYEFKPNRWFRNQMLRKTEEKELDTVIQRGI